MANTEEVLRKICDKLADGALPIEPPLHTWGTRGDGQTCGVCDEEIRPGVPAIDAESADGKDRLYHPLCYMHLANERRERG